jgi:hypothetical protein
VRIVGAVVAARHRSPEIAAVSPGHERSILTGECARWQQSGDDRDSRTPPERIDDTGWLSRPPSEGGTWRERDWSI